ncbi:hypothetical protein PENTCL1PPCAC_4252 [Pristionchus entomophagus]|uniref:F-box domain-containing protein n=1 Tax=Pristionchus entomophagus TaxID=358040 RepID=A0AAV5SFD8_9BILA|nr:hypothetical protein PENTCL1PPCAC_4252 [Pristionchus entomophagus]
MMDLNGTFGTFTPRPSTTVRDYFSRLNRDASSKLICEECKGNNCAPFKMRAELGEKDSLSNLPVDCLLSIFSYLDRDSLDVVESISQKMNHIANHKGFRKSKHQYDELIMTPNGSGFILYLNSRRDESHYLVYEYMNRKIVKTEVEGKFDYWKQRYSNMINSEALYLELFRAMHYICDNYAFFGLTITNIHLDENFLRGLLCAFDGEIPGIAMNEVTVDEGLSLPAFLLQAKTTMFSMFEVESREQTLFDEGFVRQYSIGEARTRHLCVTPKSGNVSILDCVSRYVP